MSKEFVRARDFEFAERIRKRLYELAFQETRLDSDGVLGRKPPPVQGGLMLWPAEYHALRHGAEARPESSLLVQVTREEAGPCAQACFVPRQLSTLVREIQELEHDVAKMPPDSVVYTHYHPTGGLYMFSPESPPERVRSQDLLETLGRIRVIAQEALDRSELLFVFAQYEQVVA